MLLILIGFFALILFVICYSQKHCDCSKKEGMDGFGVITALDYYNNSQTCIPGNEEEGGAFSGGCFNNGKVVL